MTYYKIESDDCGLFGEFETYEQALFAVKSNEEEWPNKTFTILKIEEIYETF